MDEATGVLAAIERQVPGLRVTLLPRRFLVYELPYARVPKLFGWGVQLGGRALAFFPDGTQCGKFRSVDQLLLVMGYAKVLRVCWIDRPEPTDPPEAIDPPEAMA